MVPTVRLSERRRKQAVLRGLVDSRHSWCALIILLFCSTSRLANAAPQIILRSRSPVSQSQTYLAGENVQLSCTFAITEGGQSPTVSWRRNNELLNTGGKFSYTQGSKLQSTLKISSITATEEGWYSCVAQNPSLQEDVDFLVLVQDPPRITLEPVQQDVVVGSTVTLACQASGHPTPEILWMRNGVAISSSSNLKIDSDTQWLTINNAAANNQGNFTCIAQNAGKSLARVTSPAVEITIDSANPLQLLSKSPDVIRASVAETFLLTVNFKGNGRPLNYTWWRNAEQIGMGSIDGPSGQTFTAVQSINVTASSAGVYSFYIDGSNVVVSSIFVQEPARVTLPDQTVGVWGNKRTVYLQCSATGNPPPQLEWADNTLGYVFPPSSKRGQRFFLVLANLFSSAVRRFTCAATNNITRSGATTMIRSTRSVNLNVIDDCQPGQAEVNNHLFNPIAALGTAHWDVSSVAATGPGARVETNSATGNAYFLVETSPSNQGGELRQRVSMPIGTANISLSFRMKIDQASGASSSKLGYALLLVQAVERSPSDVVVNNISYQTTSSSWQWYNVNITLLRGSTARGVIIRMKSGLSGSATAGARAFFDDFCLKLYIYKTAGPAFLTQLPSSSQAYLGYTLTLNCTAEGRPAPRYQWKRNGALLSGATSTTYTIHATNKVTVPGTYECVATVSQGTYNQMSSLSTSVTVIDVVTPFTRTTVATAYVVTKGSNITLQCPVGGAPITYLWLQGNVKIETRLSRYNQTSDMLTIKSAVSSDHGLYECQGNNTKGRATANVKLEVYIKPELQVNTSQYNPYNRQRNDVVTFTCPIQGDPNPTIVWRVNKVDAITLGSVDAIINATAKTLRFRFVSNFPDPTNVTCQGTNRFGQSPEVYFHIGTKVVVPTTAGPTTPPSNKEWWEESFWLDLALWIWIVIGVAVVGFLLIFLICCCCVCRRRKKRTLTPHHGRMMDYNSARRQDTVRSTQPMGDKSYIAMNPINDKIEGQPLMINNRYSRAPSVSEVPPAVPSMDSHPAYKPTPTTEEAPPPLPSMSNHPALLKKQKEAEAAEDNDGMDYLVPEEDADISLRPPAPLPTAIPDAPMGSPLAPLMEQQQYMNVDNRPPEPPPMDYENFDGGPLPMVGPRPI